MTCGGDVDVVVVTKDLEPGTLLAAYRRGLFPMPLAPAGPMGWWSPDPRGVLPLHGVTVSRSLRRSLRRFEVRTDTSFEQVVAACADESRPHGWITPEVRDAYVRLHELGWAHSVEAWAPDGSLAGLFRHRCRQGRHHDALRTASAPPADLHPGAQGAQLFQPA